MRDKREYPRRSGKASVRYRRLAGDGQGAEYSKGVVENVGLGGVFIATEEPFPQHSVVELEFEFELRGEPQTVQAKAMVRWARTMFNPAGMGLQFTEFSGRGRERLTEWLNRLKATD